MATAGPKKYLQFEEERLTRAFGNLVDALNNGHVVSLGNFLLASDFGQALVRYAESEGFEQERDGDSLRIIGKRKTFTVNLVPLTMKGE